jgi:uncharacterized protein YlxW (UPF0749 family)
VRLVRSELLAAAAFGFLVTTAVRSVPHSSPIVRGPEQTRLAALIRDEQARSDVVRIRAERLRSQVRAIRDNGARSQAGLARVSADADAARLRSGLVALSGPALLVSLNDSSAKVSPTNNLNDLVIHSQDVQAVVNGLWSAGAEAVSAAGERVIPTSAVLCVGNVLLINGTVHSPPYRFIAVGPPDELKRRFDNDPLIVRLHDDADRFGLGFTISSTQSATVPAYTGSTGLKYARPS